MDELLSEFLTECSENMTLLDVEVVTLEQNPNNLDLIGSIFRIVHTHTRIACLSLTSVNLETLPL